MQREFIITQMKEATDSIKMFISEFEQENHFTHAEAEEFLQQVEKLYRNLSVYSHSLKGNEIASDLQVHMKIMQNVSAIESNTIVEKVIEPTEEIKQEKTVETKIEEPVMLRTIELSINNKFRIANELFAQNQIEFQAALQQLNAINTQDEASHYLDSLKQIYKWKDENPLVKSFYALVQKRFS